MHMYGLNDSQSDLLRDEAHVQFRWCSDGKKNLLSRTEQGDSCRIYLFCERTNAQRRASESLQEKTTPRRGMRLAWVRRKRKTLMKVASTQLSTEQIRSSVRTGGSCSVTQTQCATTRTVHLRFRFEINSSLVLPLLLHAMMRDVIGSEIDFGKE